MLGGTGLKGRGVLPAIARQRLTAFPRSSRSISSFRTPKVTAGGYGRLNQTLAGGLTWRATTPAATVPGLMSVRFNSSSSAPASENGGDAAAQSQPGEIADLTVSDIESIPEHIGYLKDLGLDFGWGPSAMIEYVIEHFHIWTGLPWWASIVATGLMVRLSLLYPMLGAADMSTRTQNIKHMVNPLRLRMLQENSSGNMVGATRTKAEIQKLQQTHGIKPSKVFIPLVQVPLGFGCYRVVNSMTSLPVPGLTSESVGWLNDLTVADPYYILPILTASMMYLTFRKGGEAGMNEMQKTSFGKAMLYGLPMFSLCFMSFFPSALQLYFASTGLFAFCQSNLLRSDGFRKWANIALPDRSLPATNPFTDLDRSVETNGIRMLQKAVEAEKTKLQDQQKNGSSNSQEISFIDRTLNSFKENRDNIQREASDKIKELRGQAAVETNPDGSPAEQPRLGEKDLKLAADYERRRKEEDEWKREEKNRARREAHMRALEAQREKARGSWKRNVSRQPSEQQR